MALTNRKLMSLHGKQTLNLESKSTSGREQFTGSERSDAITRVLTLLHELPVCAFG